MLRPNGDGAHRAIVSRQMSPERLQTTGAAVGFLAAGPVYAVAGNPIRASFRFVKQLPKR